MVNSPKFRVWVNRQAWFRGESPEQRVERDMAPGNLRMEVRRNGKWEVEPDG